MYGLRGVDRFAATLSCVRWKRQPSDTASRPIDIALLALSRSANKGRLWFGLAVVGIVVGDAVRRGAIRGIGALSATSFAINVLIKPVIRRRRPDIELTPIGRRLTRQPWTRSFPSGHAASAAAFTTGLALEQRWAGLGVAPLAGAVAYSRVHVGVHHISDVVVGAVLGAGAAVATQHWWPLRSDEPQGTEPQAAAPAMRSGAGLMVFVNPGAGSGATGTYIHQHLPDATLIEISPDLDIGAQLDRRRSSVCAVGAVGGDGTVAAIAPAAVARELPLAVFRAGTLNHFARDLGLDSTETTVRAIHTGQAVAVDAATVSGLTFLNTASIGAYPEIVRRRDELSHAFGKWLATVIATGQVLGRHRPFSVTIDGETSMVWSIFVGNCRYLPQRPFPVWRPRLDDRLLDLHYLSAGRLSRTRAVLTTLAGISQHSGSYRSRLVPRLTVATLDGDATVALDGEPASLPSNLRFAKQPGRLIVYRPQMARPGTGRLISDRIRRAQ